MNFTEDINAAADVILRGGITLYPSDTIWGIGCDATNGIAIAKIYSLKKREENKSMIILVNDAEPQVLREAAIALHQFLILYNFWLMV